MVVLGTAPSAAVQSANGQNISCSSPFPLVWVLLVGGKGCHWCDRMRAEAEGWPLALRSSLSAFPVYYLGLKPGGYPAAAAGPIAPRPRRWGWAARRVHRSGAPCFGRFTRLLEEYYWRWFLFGGLRRSMPVAAAVVLSSLAFTAHHVILLATFSAVCSRRQSSFPSAWPLAGRPGPGSITAAARSWAPGSATP